MRRSIGPLELVVLDLGDPRRGDGEQAQLAALRDQGARIVDLVHVPEAAIALVERRTPEPGYEQSSSPNVSR